MRNLTHRRGSELENANAKSEGGFHWQGKGAMQEKAPFPCQVSRLLLFSDCQLADFHPHVIIRVPLRFLFATALHGDVHLPHVVAGSALFFLHHL